MKRRSSLSMFGLLFVLSVIVACSAVGTSSRSRSDSKGTWSAKSPMPIQISENAVAAAGNKIYVIGGSTTDRVDQQINYEYDIATDRWRSRAPLPRGMTHAAATGFNGKIYVVGAFTASGHGGAVNLVYEYDPVTDSWRTLAPFMNPRGSVGVTVLNGKIHAVGGRGPDKVTVVTHEVFDPAGGKWTELAPLPRARDHLAVVAANGRTSCDRRALECLLGKCRPA